MKTFKLGDLIVTNKKYYGSKICVILLEKMTIVPQYWRVLVLSSQRRFGIGFLYENEMKHI